MNEKKHSRKTGRAARGCAPAPCSAYWVIDTEKLGEDETFSAYGPYKSMKDAESHLRNDAAETFLDADKSLRDLAESKGWAAPVLIVEVKKTVVAVPSVKVTVKLNTPNAAADLPRTGGVNREGGTESENSG